ncbi:MAG: ABC transporter permease [Deltaproteobacteria bacterium]|nr:ABC transporter permease [Deltaproteobacteria bacterium]
MRAYLKKVYVDRLNSTTVIDANFKWFRVDWIELWQFRDLIALFVKKEFIARYRQTILGPLWYIIQPILMSGVLSVVFGKLGGLSTDEIPHLLFYFSGLVTWTYFTTAFQLTADVLVGNAYIFQKVYFPRLVMPLSVVISKSLIFFTQLSVFLVLLVVYKFFTNSGPIIHPNIFKMLILTPFVLIIASFVSLGLGLMFAAVTVKYKDLSHVLGFFIQLWFYATPIVYPVSKIPKEYYFVTYLNPLISVIDGFRSAYLGTPFIGISYFVTSFMISVLLVFVGILMFHKIERDFVDII